MNKCSDMGEDLFRKFNLKEARVNLTPCDDLSQNASIAEPQDVEVDDYTQQSDGLVYVTSDYTNFILCQSQEVETADQGNELNVLIASDGIINSDGTIIVQQGDYLTGGCIFLPIAEDQAIQVLANGELLPDRTTLTKIESSPNLSTTGFLLCSNPTSNISLTSDSTLQNDVMLGQITVGTAAGVDDDDLVGELRKFVPKRNESLSDVANDIPEYGMDWHGGGELEWTLEQSAMSEGVQISEADRLNEEFSKRMREEFAASFMKNNSLGELKKKIGNLKCPKWKEDEQLGGLSKEKDPCNEDVIKTNEETKVTNHKRRLSSESESPCKRLKKETVNEKKLKTASSKEKRREPENDKPKLKRSEPDGRNARKGADEVNKCGKKKKENKGRLNKELCRGRKCNDAADPGSVYCSAGCIVTHVEHSIELLHGKQVENMMERVVVMERKTGKLLTGPLAPTISNLLLWIQKHPTYEVLQPKEIQTPQQNNLGNKSSKKPVYKKPSSVVKKKQNESIQRSSFDSQRITIRRHIQQILIAKMNESVLMMESEVKQLAIDLENRIFNRHKAVDALYRQHYHGLVKLLRHASNEILNGETSLEDFEMRALLEDDDVLSTDASTSKHDQHFYDINCQICNPSIATDSKPAEDKQTPLSKVLSPDVTSTTDLDVADSSQNVVLSKSEISREKMETQTSCPGKRTDVDKQSLPVTGVHNEADHKPSSSSSSLKNIIPDTKIDMVWSGFMIMKDFVDFNLSSFRTSGSMKQIRKYFPSTLTILGRIAKSVVEEYVQTIKRTYSSTKEVAVICFSSDDEDLDSYKNLFSYLHSRERCGVIGSIGSTIKDVYVWPLLSSHSIPSFLLPFLGPGLDTDRGDLLLGIIVQQYANLQGPPCFLSTKTSEVAKEDSSNNGDDDDDDDDREDDIITGTCLLPENINDDHKNIDTNESPLSQSIESKIEDDLPYEPSDDSKKVESAQITADEEIQKKFDLLLDYLKQKPETFSFSSTNTSSITEKSNSSACSNQISNCETATAALASLNIFLEKFITEKNQRTVESNNNISNKSLPNFNLCEITNEQQQLMKQVLEMVNKNSKTKETQLISSRSSMNGGNDPNVICFSSESYPPRNNWHERTSLPNNYEYPDQVSLYRSNFRSPRFEYSQRRNWCGRSRDGFYSNAPREFSRYRYNIPGRYQSNFQQFSKFRGGWRGRER